MVGCRAPVVTVRLPHVWLVALAYHLSVLKNCNYTFLSSSPSSSSPSSVGKPFVGKPFSKLAMAA